MCQIFVIQINNLSSIRSCEFSRKGPSQKLTCRIYMRQHHTPQVQCIALSQVKTHTTHSEEALIPLTSTMSSSKKKYILNTMSVNLGCSSSCKRPKLSAVFHPRPRRHRTHKPHHHHHYSSSSSWDTTTPTFSSAVDTPPVCYSSDTDSDIKSLRAVQGFGRIGGSSVAVEKDSDDPYLDFRQSMLQMILEKEIYSKDDLKELLNCFLQLNSPYYHGTIVRAFTEIWNGVYSVRSGSPNLHGMWMSRDF